MKTILILLFLAPFMYAYSQESGEIELRYSTRTTTRTDGSSSSTGKMQWKLKEEQNWQDLGKRFSNIETVLKTNNESVKYLDLAKDYRRKYNIALPVTVVGAMGALFIAPNLINKYKDPNKPSTLLTTAFELLPFVGIAVGGAVVIQRFKTKSYDNLSLACGSYNKTVREEARVINSFNWGLGFGSAPAQNSYPQLSFRIGLN